MSHQVKKPPTATTKRPSVRSPRGSSVPKSFEKASQKTKTPPRRPSNSNLIKPNSENPNKEEKREHNISPDSRTPNVPQKDELQGKIVTSFFFLK